jgi:uncharacterized RDD family membrane protein YckC
MEKYQTFGRRVGAYILDSILLLAVNWFLTFALMASPLLMTNGAPIMLLWAIPSFIAALYDILMHYFRGQTLGKMAVKVKVLSDSETPINLGQSIARSLPQLITPMFAVSFATAADFVEAINYWNNLLYGVTVAFSIINAVVCLANEKRRALHDFIAGTVVVRTDV